MPPLRAAVLTYTLNGSTSVTLNWEEKGPSPTTYTVQRNGGDMVTLGGSYKTHTDTTIVAGQTYTYRVRSARPNGTIYSNTVTVVVTAPVSLGAPTLTGTAGPGTASLSWTLVTNATDYTIQRATGAGAFGALTTTPNLSHVDSTGTPETLYRYQVKATANAGALSGSYSNIVSVTPTAAAPVAPTLTGTAGDGSATLDWNAVATAATYRVRRSVAGGAVVQLDEITATDYIDDNAVNGSVNQYTVRGVTAGGVLGAISNAVNLTPLPSGNVIPSTIDGTGATDVTTAMLTWLKSIPAGGTAVLKAGAIYRCNGQMRMNNRNGLTIEGNGATFQRQTDANNSLFAFEWGGNDIHLRNFTVQGGNTQPGISRSETIEFGHSIDFRGVLRATVSNVTSKNTTGECVYIAGGRLNGGGDSTFRPSDDIVISDCWIEGTGRMGIAITDGGDNVTIQRCTFKNVALYAFDIEPNVHPELGSPGANDCLFNDNDYYPHTTGPYAGTSHIVSVTGGGINDNITISNNHAVNCALRFNIYGGPNRITDVAITGNVGDAIQGGTAVELNACDRVQVTGNSQPPSLVVYQSGCTSVTISGNTG